MSGVRQVTDEMAQTIERLQAERDALAEEVRALLHAQQVRRQEDEVVRAERDAALAREAALKRALSRYGEHDSACPFFHSPGSNCGCGLTALHGGKE